MGLLMSSITLMRPACSGVSTPSVALASRARIRSHAIRSAHVSAPLRSNAAPISLIERSTAATELMCWAGAVVAAHGRTRPISHCEEGVALCCSCEVGWGLSPVQPATVTTRTCEEVVHNSEGRLGDD